MKQTLLMVFILAWAVPMFSERPPHARPNPETFHAALDPKLLAYKPRGQLSGSLSGVQSDTTPGLLALWIDGFRNDYPNVQITASIAGSGAPGPVLTEQ